MTKGRHLILILVIVFSLLGIERSYAGLSKTVEVAVLKVEIQNPKDSPVTAPQEKVNEFTFDSSASGVLKIECRAKPSPDNADIRNYLENKKVRWTITSIGSSVITWDSPWPSDHTKGEGLTATATFTGLPVNSGDFGQKTVTMEVYDDNGSIIITKTAPIEVFFTKTASNHPGGEVGSPNWYFYWNQVIGTANTSYAGAGAGPLAEVMGMTHWSYFVAPDKSTLYIYDSSALTHGGCPYLGSGPWTGIDLYANIFSHERHHTTQITNADAVVGTAAATPWRHGWSWNVANHNHWSVGPDGKPGVKNVDDDGDKYIDNLLTSGPGELGNGDDKQLDVIVFHWPDAWGAPPSAPWCQGHPIEHEAYKVMTNVEHTLAGQDWGNPGKQHQTINNYSD